MTRRDWYWLLLRGAGVFLLTRAVLALPAAIMAVRMKERLLGPGAEELAQAWPVLGLGVSGALTTVAVYAVAGGILMSGLIGPAGGGRGEQAVG